MSLPSQALIGLVALLHLYFLWLEMFAWETQGPKVFRAFPKDLFSATRPMMANQGLYNGFLAAGLIWSLVAAAPLAVPVATFFLSCVAVAGIFGAATVSRRILYVQAVPALAALALLWLG